MAKPHFQDKAVDPTIDVYTNSWTPYPSISSPAVHLFFPSMFHHFGHDVPFTPQAEDGILDIRIVASRGILGNLSYTSAANSRSPFVALGVNDCGANTPSVRGGWCDPSTTSEAHTSVDTSTAYMASGFLPSHDGLELHLYSSGSPNTHGEWAPGKAPGGRNAWGNNTGVRILRLRKDGFVSVDAPYPTSNNLTALPSFTTVPITVPSDCAPAVPRVLPGPNRTTACSYQLPDGKCDAEQGAAGWHNVTCVDEFDCSKLCGTCRCHSQAATCRPNSDGRSYCDTGRPGGQICHATFVPGNNTGVAGGVQLLLNTETSVVGFVAVELLNQKGEVVAGMAAEDADQIKGSAIGAVASWNNGALATLSALAGQTVQLRVVMADAKIFAIRLACAPNASTFVV